MYTRITECPIPCCGTPLDNFTPVEDIIQEGYPVFICNGKYQPDIIFDYTENKTKAIIIVPLPSAEGIKVYHKIHNTFYYIVDIEAPEPTGDMDNYKLYYFELPIASDLTISTFAVRLFGYIDSKPITYGVRIVNKNFGLPLNTRNENYVPNYINLPNNYPISNNSEYQLTVNVPTKKDFSGSQGNPFKILMHVTSYRKTVTFVKIRTEEKLIFEIIVDYQEPTSGYSKLCFLEEGLSITDVQGVEEYIIRVYERQDDKETLKSEKTIDADIDGEPKEDIPSKVSEK